MNPKITYDFPFVFPNKTQPTEDKSSFVPSFLTFLIQNKSAFKNKSCQCVLTTRFLPGSRRFSEKNCTEAVRLYTRFESFPYSVENNQKPTWVLRFIVQTRTKNIQK